MLALSLSGLYAITCNHKRQLRALAAKAATGLLFPVCWHPRAYHGGSLCRSVQTQNSRENGIRMVWDSGGTFRQNAWLIRRLTLSHRMCSGHSPFQPCSGMTVVSARGARRRWYWRRDFAHAAAFCLLHRLLFSWPLCLPQLPPDAARVADGLGGVADACACACAVLPSGVDGRDGAAGAAPLCACGRWCHEGLAAIPARTLW